MCFHKNVPLISSAFTGVVGCRLLEREVVLLTNQRLSNRWYVHVTTKYCVVFWDGYIPNCGSGAAYHADDQTVFDRPGDGMSFKNRE